jgi:threonylcarbamoyladenosine tRNA methylthiotransferase MtaB
LNRDKTVAFHTLGCRVNQYETQALREKMADLGFRSVDDGEAADVYVINTCTVTGVSDRKSRQLIRRAKRSNPSSIVAVIGCYAQTRPDETAAMPEADIVLGSGDKSRLPALIEEYIAGKAERVFDVSSLDVLTAYDDLGAVTAMDSRTRAYIKIEDGCDRYCAYCVVPYARGAVRSRIAEDIVDEAKRLISRGYKELVLTGVNLALYGSDFIGGADYRLHDIVRLLDGLEGDFRIRLGSLEPTVVNVDYIKHLLVYRKLCPSMHLSLQSGSTRVLREMGRSYTREDYIGLVDELTRFDAAYGVSTDIIVGFPGETDEDFAESMSMIEMLGFSHTHVFQYSKREGTRAASLCGQIPAEVKARRSRALIIKAAEASKTFINRNIGSVKRVLTEKRDPETGLWEGLSENNMRVFFHGGADLEGRFTDVRIKSGAAEGALGECED